MRQQNTSGRGTVPRQPRGTSHTANIPVQRRAHQGTSSSGSRTSPQNARTGSAPYLYGQNAQRRPVPRKRREPLYIIVLRWLYIRRRAVTLALGVFLIACITIPLAVYASSTAGENTDPDFEILDKAPENTDIISADLSGGAFDAPFHADTNDDKNTGSADPGGSDMGDPSTEPDGEETEADSTTEPVDTDLEDSSAIENPDDTADPEGSDTAPATDDMSDTTAEPDTMTEDIPEPEPTGPVPVETIPEETVEEIVINEFPVTIAFYDREAITCLTGPATLREILYSAGYTLRDTDRPTVSLDEMIEGESWIMIDTVTYESVTESEAIPFEVETYEVQTVPRGTTQTVTYGVNGSLDKVYTVEYVNGVEVNRTFEYEYVSSYPTNQINQYGTGGTFYAPDGTAYSYSYYVYVRATYYNLYGNTASGMPTGNNVIAVDPSVFPLGTQVYVMNDYYDMGIKIAADTGGAVKGNIIDIWMDENHPYYYQFTANGVSDMIAYVLD